MSSHTPILPNFFVEAKGPDGSAAEIKRQITQDLGVGARGMLQMQHYEAGNKSYDENAHTLGSTFHDGALKIYSCHPTAPTAPGGRPNYHVYQVTSFAMTDTPESFRKGATAYRNGQNWAEEQRNAAIERVRNRVEARRITSKQDSPEDSFASVGKPKSLSPESVTSAVESALEVQGTSERLRKHSKQSQTDRERHASELSSIASIHPLGSREG